MLSGEHTRCWLGAQQTRSNERRERVQRVLQRDERSRQMPQTGVEERGGWPGTQLQVTYTKYHNPPSQVTVPNPTATRDEHEAPGLRSPLPPSSSRAPQT